MEQVLTLIVSAVDVDGLVLGVVHYGEAVHAAHTDPAATDNHITPLWSTVYT